VRDVKHLLNGTSGLLYIRFPLKNGAAFAPDHAHAAAAIIWLAAGEVSEQSLTRWIGTIGHLDDPITGQSRPCAVAQTTGLR